jgi:hypothetical protein
VCRSGELNQHDIGDNGHQTSTITTEDDDRHRVAHRVVCGGLNDLSKSS